MLLTVLSLLCFFLISITTWSRTISQNLVLNTDKNKKKEEFNKVFTFIRVIKTDYIFTGIDK